MSGTQIRFAQPTDAAEISKLFSSGFAPQVAQLLIHGCKGASEHIRMQLASGAPNAESAYFVAHTPDSIVGAAEMRRQPGSLFLNYIAVHPGHRGQHVGATLLLGAVRMSGVSFGQIGLDVFHDNARALQWYSRLGFTTRTSADFLEVASPGGESEDSAYLSGLPQADLCQKRFGFSKFSIITRKGVLSVGRIGDTWFRLTDPVALGNPSVFAVLSQLDARRRMFAVVPALSARTAHVIRVLTKTHRMEAEVSHVLSSLCNGRHGSV